MADVLLFPAESNPEDVRLREGGVAEPTTYTVAVSATAVGDATTIQSATHLVAATATAVGSANIGTVLSLGAPPVALSSFVGGGYAPPLRPRWPVTNPQSVRADVTCQPSLTIKVDPAGRRLARRREEDEFVLIGVL